MRLMTGDFCKLKNGYYYQVFDIPGKNVFGTNIDNPYWGGIKDDSPDGFYPSVIYRPRVNPGYNINRFKECRQNNSFDDYYDTIIVEPVEGTIYETDYGYYYYTNKSYVPLNTNKQYNNKPINQYTGFGTVADFLRSKLCK